MKKITFLLLFMIACASINYAQCINNSPYPSDTILSDNSGDFQEINTCVYTGNFSTVSNINLGQDYVFSLESGGETVNKYITITDVDNNIIGHGETPLTVAAIQVGSIRIHYTEGPDCETEEWCLRALFRVVLTCPFPTDIEISNVTLTNASFNWTPGNAEEAWEVLVLPKGTEAPAASTSGNPVSGEPEYSVNNLEAAHQYQFYVRADCGSEYSPWRGPYNFNSGCEAVALLDENFDTTADGDLPLCWTGLLVNAANDTFVTTSSFMGFSAPNSLQMANGGAPAGAKILLISPNLSTVGTATHRLKFYTRGYGNVSFEVGTINTTTADGVFDMIDTIDATSNYTEHTIDFTSYTGPDTYIAFRHPNASTYNPVFLDDIRWEAAPLCGDVSDITVTALTETTAAISWEPGGSETAWDVVFSETESDPSLLTPISPSPSGTPEATFSGLEAITTFKVWVRSSCGEIIGNGAWMDPVTFTTACPPVNVLNETFETTDNGDVPECWTGILAGSSVVNSYIKVESNNAAFGTKAVALFNGDGPTDSKIILVSPHLGTVATSTHRVKFFARANAPATIQVGTMESPAGGAEFTSLQPLTITPGYAEYVVDFSNYTGNDNYIAIKHASDLNIVVYLDNIRWEVTPLCADVTGVSVNNITAGSASVQWIPNANETQWDVVYATEDVTDPNSITPITPAPSTNPEATLSDLEDNTAYKVWVRSVCGGELGNGAWIGPYSFKTACLPTASFVEDFETTETGSLPDCWSAILAGPSLGQYAAVRTVDHDSAIGNNAVELHVGSSEPTDLIMLVSPNLGTLNAGTHRLKFYALSYNQDTVLQIGTMNGNTSNATYTSFQPVPLGNGYAEYIVDFTTYTGTDTYIAFRNSTGFHNSIFVDLVRWEIIPACSDVDDLSFSDVTDSTATINWSAGGSETNWQVAYAPVSVSDPSTLTPSEILTATSMQLSELDANSFYNVWVRSVCDAPDGNGAWIGPLVIHTRCSSTTVPYLQDFESASIPNLPDCSILENGSQGNNWETTYGDSAFGFDGKVMRYWGNSNDASAWYFTQGITLTGGAEYAISYKYGNNSSDNYVESMQVLFGQSATGAGMTQEIADHEIINTGMAINNEVIFTPTETGIYYFGFLAYSAANQSQLYLDDIAVNPTLSTPGSEVLNFSYYPNPVKDLLTISYSEMITNVVVFNLLGQKVLENNTNQQNVQLDMSGLSSGSYIVKATAGGITKTIKIIKE